MVGVIKVASKIRTRSPASNGFTIVELLIVIVVIAILAAITLVGYNGVSTKARNVQTISSVEQYAKVLENYATTNGSYPIVSYVCLGPSGTSCANMTNNTVSSTCNYIGNMVYSGVFDAALKTQTSSLPAPSTQQMDCGGINASGAWYNSADGKLATMVYYLSGSTQNCVTSSAMTLSYTYQSGSTTACYMTLPTP